MAPAAVFHLDSIVSLNVGGQRHAYIRHPGIPKFRFDTALKTLLVDRNGETFKIFAVFLEPDPVKRTLPQKDTEGRYFLDRDPDQFRLLLNSLRYLAEFQEQQKWENGTDEDNKSIKSNGFWNKWRRRG